MRELIAVVVMTGLIGFFSLLRADPEREESVREVDTFTTSGRAGQLKDWMSFDKKFGDFYKVMQEEKNYFLRAEVQGNSVIIAKDFKYNLKEFPFLSWRWRVHVLPEGADEGQRSKSDSAAGVYVIFPCLIKPEKVRNHFGFQMPVPDTLKPECIKYVWSSSLPRGTVVDSPFSSKTKIIVLQSGKSALGQWVTEEVNVYEDYKKSFGKEPGDVRAIGILSDADNTSSKAVADYDDIFIKKKSRRG